MRHLQLEVKAVEEIAAHAFTGLHSLAGNRVEGFLDELQARTDAKGGPLVTLLPKAPGAREPRWAHLLCGPVDASVVHASHEGSGAGSSQLEARIEALESEVDSLRSTVQRLCAELGISPEVPAMSQPGQE